MPNVAVITIGGHVGGDPELKSINRYDGTTTQVCEFSVAVNSSRNDEDPPVWYRVSVWGNYGQTMAGIIRKGQAVAVVGDLHIRTYMGNDGEQRYSADVTARNVIAMGNAQEQSHRTQSSAPQASAPHASALSGGTDDIPF